MAVTVVSVAPGTDTIQATLDANAGAAALELQVSNGDYFQTKPPWVAKRARHVVLVGGGEARITPFGGGQAYHQLLIGNRPVVPGDFAQTIGSQPAGQRLDGGVNSTYCYRLRPTQRIQFWGDGVSHRSWTQSLAAPNWDAWAGTDDFSLSFAVVVRTAQTNGGRFCGLATFSDSSNPAPVLVTSDLHINQWTLQLALTNGTTATVRLPSGTYLNVQSEVTFQFKLSTGVVYAWVNKVPVTPTVTGLFAGAKLVPNWGEPWCFWGDTDMTLLGWSWQPAATYVPGSNPQARTDGNNPEDSHRRYFFGTTGDETHGWGNNATDGFVSANVPALGAYGVYLDADVADASKAIDDIVLDGLTITGANYLGQCVSHFNVARTATTTGLTVRRCKLTGGMIGLGSPPFCQVSYDTAVEGGLLDGSDAGLFGESDLVYVDCDFGPGGRTQVRLRNAGGRVYQRMSFNPPDQCECYADIRFSDNPVDFDLRLGVDDEKSNRGSWFVAAVRADQSRLGKVDFRLQNRFDVPTPDVPVIALSGSGGTPGDCVLTLPARTTGTSGTAAVARTGNRWRVVASGMAPGAGGGGMSGHWVAGDSYVRSFGTGATNADSLPTALVLRNGAVDGTVTVTVTNTTTGLYKTSCTIPGGYAGGDLVEVLTTYTMSGATQQALDSFRLMPVANSIDDNSLKVPTLTPGAPTKMLSILYWAAAKLGLGARSNNKTGGSITTKIPGTNTTWTTEAYTTGLTDNVNGAA